jgi:hypothetical protein
VQFLPFWQLERSLLTLCGFEAGFLAAVVFLVVVLAIIILLIDVN